MNSNDETSAVPQKVNAGAQALSQGVTIAPPQTALTVTKEKSISGVVPRPLNPHREPPRLAVQQTHGTFTQSSRGPYYPSCTSTICSVLDLSSIYAMTYPSTASLLSQSTTSTTVSPLPPKDYMSAFATLQSTYGTTGHFPTPVAKPSAPPKATNQTTPTFHTLTQISTTAPIKVKAAPVHQESKSRLKKIFRFF